MVLRGNGIQLAELRPLLEKLKGCAHDHDAQGIKKILLEMVPEYTPEDNEAVF